MSKRVLSGSSSEDEQVGLLGGSGVNSRRARFEVQWNWISPSEALFGLGRFKVHQHYIV